MPHALIVDDEPLMRQTLAQHLQAFDHTWSEAGSVVEAVEKLDQEQFDYVLLDLNIPFAPKGPILPDYGERCLSEIRKHGRNRLTGVVIVTGQYEVDAMVDLMTKGADHCIGKPVHKQRKKFREPIEHAIRKYRERLDEQRHRAEEAAGAEDRRIVLEISPKVVSLAGIVLYTNRTIPAKIVRYIAESEGTPMAKEIGGAVGLAEEKTVTKYVTKIRRNAAALLKKNCLPALEGSLLVNNRGAQGYFINSQVRVVQVTE